VKNLRTSLSSFAFTLLAASLLLPAPLVGQQSLPAPPGRVPTLFSKDGVEAGTAPRTILSPDGTKSLSVSMIPPVAGPDMIQSSYRVELNGEPLEARLSGWDGEIAWSPDSNAFAVTQTVGGGGIGYRAYVFYPEAGGLRKVDVSKVIEKSAGYSRGCEIPVYPNTGVIEWLGPQRLLLAAQVVPVSICKCAGSFTAYEVSLPEGKIVKTYSEAETEEQFGRFLGAALQLATPAGECKKTHTP
jgi:hypothetical protein